MKIKNIIKIMIGVTIAGILMIGIIIPVSAAPKIEQITSDTVTASASVIGLNKSNVSIAEGNTYSLSATTQPSGLSVT